jgi:hypothetical protein
VLTKSVARLPPASRTQAVDASEDNAKTATRVAELEAELSAAVRTAAERQADLDRAVARAAQNESNMKATIEQLEQRVARLARDLEGTLEKANSHRLAAAAATQAASQAEKEKAKLMGELVSAIASLEAEKKVGYEVLQTVGPLEARATELTQLLSTVPSADDYERLRTEHETLKKDSLASMQKSKLVIASLRRKVDEQDTVIRTLTEDIGSEETKNSQLRGQLVHVLEDRIESSSSASSSAGCVEDKPAASGCAAAQSATTIFTATASSPAPVGQIEAAKEVGDDDESRSIETPKERSSMQSSRAARRSAAVSASVAMASSTRAMSAGAMSQPRRQKRKSDAVDDDHGDQEQGDKENDVVLPLPSKSTVRASKKSRKQRGGLFSPSKQHDVSGVARSAGTPTSRVSAMLTPIKRALRSRRGKK